MTYTIAIAGKGGTGKTTVSSSLVRYLKEEDAGSILAIDADPNANLGQLLDAPAGKSIVEIVDDISARMNQIPSGMTKDRFVEYRIQEELTEADGFDLLSMGRPEGPGCYCYINSVLRTMIEKLSQSYDYVVVDCEAGMEHISRRTTRKMDLLLLVSDPTIIGVRSAKRILDLVGELKIEARCTHLVINKISGSCKPVEDEARRLGFDSLLTLPWDGTLEKISLEGGSINKLNKESKIYKSIRQIGDKILVKKGV